MADTFTLILGPGQDMINQLAGTTGIQNLHNIFCKVGIIKRRHVADWVLFKWKSLPYRILNHTRLCGAYSNL